MGVEKVKNYPYNFVSLGDKVLNRGKRVIGNNTGTLKCKLRTYSPLFIMGDRLLKNGHSEEYFLKKDNEYLIPSSTLKGEIRTIIDDKNDVWFCLKDVCDMLEIGNSSDVKNRLDNTGVDTIEVSVNTGLGERLTKINFINEDNFYDCILDSRKPNAKRIRKWVTSDILPSIRKTGMYLSDNVFDMMMRNPEKIGEMLIEYGR